MNEPRRTASIVWVKKRDGRPEPYEKSKVSACLRNVIAATGEGSPSAARELTEAVTIFVLSSRHGQPLRTRQITALLVRVLEETGHPVAAEILREHGRQRDQRRNRVQVLAWKASSGRSVPRRWNKSVLVSRLQRAFGLESGTARMIAARVEEVVLALDLRLVSGGLVRELAENEMAAWGLTTQALSTRPFAPQR